VLANGVAVEHHGGTIADVHPGPDSHQIFGGFSLDPWGIVTRPLGVNNSLTSLPKAKQPSV
jgi:hypothetical protein